MSERIASSTEIDLSFLANVSLGNYQKAHIGKRILGLNFDIDTAAEETVWTQGGSYVFNTIAETLNITSSSASDTSAGTGARTVFIEGLDTDYNMIEETVTLNGTSNVLTVNSYLRVNNMYVATSGSSQTNEGDITATSSGEAKLLSLVTADCGTGLVGVYTVPNGYDGYMTSEFLSCTNVSDSQSNLVTYFFDENGNLGLGQRLSATSNGNNYVKNDFGLWVKVPSKTDIVLASNVTANDTEVGAGFEIVLIRD